MIFLLCPCLLPPCSLQSSPRRRPSPTQRAKRTKLILNLSPGFLAYLLSNWAFYYSPIVREQYALRHRGLPPTVQFNDIAFAAHALLLSVITTSQYCFPQWGFRVATPSPSRPILGLSFGCLVAVALVALRVYYAPPTPDARGWCALDIAYAVSYVKLVVTVVKFTPQVVANYRNRSTKGWSISQILLDMAGGVLSVGQLCVDAWLQRDWAGITGNPVKFALGNVSMFYDAIFMWQHYVLYNDPDEKPEQEGILGAMRED